MTLQQLRDFVLAVEHGSLRRAALHGHQSQVSLTKSIKRLELSLGTELLLRNSRGITLTPSGEHLLPHRGARGAVGLRRQLLERDGRHLDVQVDPVEQRPADPAQVLLDHDRVALARPARVAEVAARAAHSSISFRRPSPQASLCLRPPLI